MRWFNNNMNQIGTKKAKKKIMKEGKSGGPFSEPAGFQVLVKIKIRRYRSEKEGKSEMKIGKWTGS